MILTELERVQLLEAAKPLIKFINEINQPHVTVIVDSTDAQILQLSCRVRTEEFLKD